MATSLTNQSCSRFSFGYHQCHSASPLLLLKENTIQKRLLLCNFQRPIFSIVSSHNKHPKKNPQNPLPRNPQTPISRREVFLRSSELAVLAALFQFSGTKPSYLGVQKNSPSLALCPATPNCITSTEELNDPAHYVPPWIYNPPEGRGRTNMVSRDQAMAELIDVIKNTRPDNSTPRIVEKRDDYLHVEYESPIFGFVDDVEFWFPPGNKSVVEYRSASRVGSIDFDVNRKRIKALRLALEKKGWPSQSS